MTPSPALLLLLAPLFGNPDQEPYDVRRIPPGLKGTASAVVRIFSQKFEVRNDRKAIYTVRKAVTIFDKDERDHGVVVLWYGGTTDIEDLEGVLYDAEGNEIRDLEEADIKDYAAFDGFSLYSDARVRIASLFHHQYPYTVEFTYELSYDGFVNWPRWYSRRSTDPVQESVFEVISPRDLRYWCNRDSVSPGIVTDGSRKTYRWEARNLPDLGTNIIADLEDISTMVLVAPSTFEIEGSRGSMESWASIGSWYLELARGRNNLPAEAIAEIRGLVDPSASIKTKVETVYRYMQNRTRYVSVQLGLGGWQPYDARFVHERGYGDCKALTNYTQALLEAVHVPSFPVLINSGSDRVPLIEEFPSQQFNHVILCVPLDRDSLWLECTSQTLPAGHIGSSNEDRGALLLSPEKPVIVRTPTSRAEQNTQQRAGTIRLLANGDAHAVFVTTVSGNQQDRLRHGLGQTTLEEQRRWILADLQIPHVNLLSFAVNGLETREPVVSLEVSASLPGFAVFSGGRLFVRPNLTERASPPSINAKVRLSPVRFPYPFHDSDSLFYRLPVGFVPESLPPPVSLQTTFGSFSASVHPRGDTAVVFQRALTIWQKEIPQKDYDAYRAFFQAVSKADRAQAVFARK